MDRRTFVRATGVAGIAGLAGCLGGRTGSGDTDSPTTDSPASERTVSLTAVDGFEDGYGASIDVSVPTPSFTGRPGGDDAHPAAVEVTLANESDERKEWGLGFRTVFSTVYSEGGDYALLGRDLNPDFLEPDCWTLAEPLAFPAVVRVTELSPGESASRSFSLVGSQDADACPPTGEVTFTENFDESVPAEEETPTDRVERPVSFTLEVA